MRIKLPHKLVYWAPAGVDGYGMPKLAAPVELACRWEDRVSNTVDAKGNEAVSSATVYLLTPVALGGLMHKGLLTDVQGSGFPPNPRDHRNVHEIINVGSAPNIRGTQTLITASLK